MTRLAFGLDQWDSAVIRRRGAADRGGDPERGGHVHQRAPVGLPPAADDPRPAPGRPPVLRLPRRRHRPLPHRRHAAPGDAVRARAGDRGKDPDAPNWVNQRVIKTHGIGVAMVPVNEVTPEGQPRLWIRDLPPTSNSGAPEITQPRIYFGESDSHYVVVRAQPAGVRLSRATRTRASGDPTTSWTGQTGIPLDSTLTRLLFALRFRDFDLLITDQVTGRQPAAVPPDDVRAAGHDRAVPALRQGPLPRRRRRPARLRPGRVHDQRPVPERRLGSTRRSSAADVAASAAERHQLHPQQREDHDGRLRRHDALLRRATRPTR